MKLDPNLPNRLRSWFGSLAFVALLVAGLAYGATWVVRTGLEREAVAEAARAAQSVVRPALQAQDVAKPMTGERYTALRETVRRRVITGPVIAVEVWNEDGTIVFADRRSRLGEAFPAMREPLHEARIAGSLRLIEGDTFRALVAVAVGESSAVVELDRPYADILGRANARWRPWIGRGVRAAIVFLALYAAAVAASIVVRRRRAGAVEELPQPVRTGNAARIEDAHVSVRRRKSDDPDRPRPDGPAYMQPGFREHLEARREAEDAVASAQHALSESELERQRLQQRLEQTEAELQEARRRLAELGATAGR